MAQSATSTPIFKRRLHIPLLTGLALSACLGPSDTVTRDGVLGISVTDYNVMVTGPQGFCIDETSSRQSRKDAFVVLASCASLSNRPLAPQPNSPLILTASITPAPLFSPSQLESYFRSPDGLKRINVSGMSETVRFETSENTFYVQTSGDDGTRWRGLFGLRPGLLVTLKLDLPPGTDATPDNRGFATIQEFVARIRASNRNLATGSDGLS